MRFSNNLFHYSVAQIFLISITFFYCVSVSSAKFIHSVNSAASHARHLLKNNYTTSSNTKHMNDDSATLIGVLLFLVVIIIISTSLVFMVYCCCARCPRLPHKKPQKQNGDIQLGLYTITISGTAFPMQKFPSKHLPQMYESPPPYQQ